MRARTRPLLVVLAALFAAAPPAMAQEVEPQIVAGNDAAPGELPYQVYLTSGPFECGGSILDKRHVVTAGHCVVDDEGFYPRVRAPGEIAVEHGSVNFFSLTAAPAVATVSVDRRYLRDGSDAYDSAVLTLAGDLPTNANTDAVPLAAPSDVNAALDGTPEAVISGWGVTDPDTEAVSNTLQKATVPLVTDSACRADYPELVDSVMLCAGSRSPFPNPRVEDACQGDSGGPLTVSGKLAGIVSFGEDCGRFPGVYTEVNETATRALLEDDSQAGPPTAAGGPTVSGLTRVGQSVTCNPRPQGGAVVTGYRWYSGARTSANQIGAARTITVPSSAQGSAIFCDARLEGTESGFAYSTAAQASGPVSGPSQGGVTQPAQPAAAVRLLSDIGFGGFPGRRTSLRRVLRRGLAGRVSCDADCGFRAELVLPRRSARRARIRGRVAIVSRVRSRDAAGGGGRAIRFRFSRRTARKLRRLTRGTAVEVRVTASDSSGTRRVEKKKLRLRR